MYMDMYVVFIDIILYFKNVYYKRSCNCLQSEDKYVIDVALKIIPGLKYILHVDITQACQQVTGV